MAAPSTFLRRNGGKLAFGAAGGGGIYYLLTSTGTIFTTPGVRNVERAYTAGGGSATHQPAYSTAARRRTDVGETDGAGVIRGQHIKDRDNIGDVQRAGKVS